MRKDTVEIILCSVDHTDLYHSTKTQHFRSIQETLLNLGGYNNNPSIVSSRINALNFKDQHPLTSWVGDLYKKDTPYPMGAMG